MAVVLLLHRSQCVCPNLLCAFIRKGTAITAMCVLQVWSVADAPVTLAEVVPVISAASQGGDTLGMMPVFDKQAPKKKSKRNKPRPVQQKAVRDDLDDEVDVVCMEVYVCLCSPWLPCLAWCVRVQPYPMGAISPTGLSPDVYRPSAGNDRDDQSSYSSIPDFKYEDEQRCPHCDVLVRAWLLSQWAASCSRVCPLCRFGRTSTFVTTAARTCRLTAPCLVGSPCVCPHVGAVPPVVACVLRLCLPLVSSSFICCIVVVAFLARC